MSISVFDQTSTLLLECLVPILKPFLSDPNCDFIKKLKAETDVEINHEKEEGNDVFSFAGDFASISRANEIISELFWLLSGSTESQCQIIDKTILDADKTVTTVTDTGGQNMGTSTTLDAEQTIPINSLTESQIKTESEFIQEGVGGDLVISNDLDISLSCSDSTNDNYSELEYNSNSPIVNMVKHNYKLRKITSKFSKESLMKYEKDSDFDINDEDPSDQSFDEEYIPSNDDNDRNSEQDINEIKNPHQGSVGVRNYESDSETVQHVATSDEVNPPHCSSDTLNYVEIVYILETEIGSILKENYSDQMLSRGKCKFCPYNNLLKHKAAKKELKSHYRRQHVKRDLIHTCVICNKKFGTKGDFNSHKQLHERKTCEICGKSIIRRQFSMHAKRHRVGFLANTHECDLCKKKFPSRHRLKIHKATQHSDHKEMYSCQVCEKQLSTKTSLVRHLKGVHKIDQDSTRSSDKTDKVSVSNEIKNELNEDFDNVETVTTFKIDHGSITKEMQGDHIMGKGKCMFCSYSNFLKYNNAKKELKSHYRRQHVKRDLIHSCVICNQKFGTNRDLNIHKQLHERKTCEICGKSIIRRQFSKHAKRHRAGFVANIHECDLCNRKYPSRHRLKVHKATLHSDHREMYPCHVCGKQLSTKTSLASHVKNVHKIDQDSFTCEICGKYFNDRQYLNKHLLKHDTSYEKPLYTCSICDKVFTTKPGIKFHMNTHDGTKDYLCSYCGKSFNCNNSLRRHILIHTGEKPYSCGQCTTKFNDSSILRRHMMLVHKRTADNWKD